ncbi:MAG: hypothetical protein PHT19_10430 [Methylococcus sp.]|nr:hypothetical protein [Methylococcus sp.]
MNIAHRTHSTHRLGRIATPRPKRPPYASTLNPRPSRHQSLFVVTGSAGWDAFRHGGIGYAVLLPYQTDPASFRWPDLSAWPDGLLLARGEPESSDTLKALVSCLLAAGLPKAVMAYAPFTTFQRRPSQ